MNAAAILLGCSGAAVAVFAVASKSTAQDSSTQPRTPAPPPPPRLASSSAPALRADNETIPAHLVQLADGVPPGAIKAGTTSTPAPAGRSARQAATDLYAYVVPLIKAGNGAALGTKAEPNDIVRVAQRDMKITADGSYGDKTRARGKELLGREFPARAPKGRVPAPAPRSSSSSSSSPAAAPKVLRIEPQPAAKLAAAAPPPPPEVPVNEHSPKEAAAALLQYVQSSGNLGTKAKPSDIVKAAQHDMGKLTADGVYGPKTRERGKQLLGKPFPAR